MSKSTFVIFLNWYVTEIWDSSSFRISTFLYSSLLVDLKAHELDPEKPCPSVELLCEVNKYLEWAGIYDPYEKVYLDTSTFRSISAAMTLLTISQLSKLNYMKTIDSLIGKKSAEHIDGISFIVGILTVLRQFHIEAIQMYIDQMAQYVISMADHSLQ